MARCKDCIHEKVCSALIKYGLPWNDEKYSAEKLCFEFLNKADVVPMSEYEKLIGKLECLLCHATGGRLSKHTYDLRTMEAVVTDCANETYNDGFAEGYKESAMEIFEEIDGIIAYDNFPIAHQKLVSEFAELKKKYTESEDKP